MTSSILGAPVDRVDGPRKVQGAVPYASDVTYPDLAHAALVQAPIAAGAIRSIDVSDAELAPGVIAVITRASAPALAEPPDIPFFPSARSPFKDDRILYHGQIVAVVVAESAAGAAVAARLVRVEYDEATPVFTMEDPKATTLRNPYGFEATRGDVKAGLAGADVVYDETFRMPVEANAPMGLFATVAHWDGDRLVVHDATQWPLRVRHTLAVMLGLPQEQVRVLAPYMGGGFGAGLRVWPHVPIAALAARVVRRPVKLVLTRPQMFNSIGNRPETIQRLRIGATRDGRLVAIDHEGISTQGMEVGNIELVTLATGASYACPNLATHDGLIPLNIPPSNAKRGPGAIQGNFALESALDELSYQLRMDPVELRLRNYAEVHPPSGQPWSSKALRECFRVGAERFGWSDRNGRVGSMQAGRERVGLGMAGVTYEWYSAPCKATLTLQRDGRVRMRSAATDIGTGTYTIATQLVAELLGVDVSQVDVEIGDSDLPLSPQSGGSGLAISLSGAIEDAAAKLRQKIDKLGRLTAGDSFADLLARHELLELTAEGEITPDPSKAGMAPAPAFAAHFVEVRVDQDLGRVRVARVVSVVDGGRVLNHKLARSQVMGGVVMGIGTALLEETIFDSTGRIANGTFGDYLIPVNADIPDIDVTFVGEPDRFNAMGIKGLGEIGTIGIAPAIANAVFHATGRRLRSLPITLDRLL